ncbi:MAG: hypothetical protein ACFE85_16590 [Candidatus Hodarchaeota archaeon]
MAYAISLNREALDHIQKDYVKVMLNPIQLKVIQIFSNRLCELINIPVLAMRGIIWSALGEWQIKSNKKVSEMANYSVHERLINAKEIFNITKRRLKEILLDPSKQSEIDMLDILFEQAFKYYMNYLQRSK